MGRRGFLTGSVAGLACACAVPSAKETDTTARVNFALGVLWARVPASRWLTPAAHALVVSPMDSSLSALLMNDNELGFEAPPRALFRTSMPPSAKQSASLHHSVLIFFTPEKLDLFLRRAAEPDGASTPGDAVAIDRRLARQSTRPDDWRPRGVLFVRYSDDGFVSGDEKTQRVLKIAGS